MAVEKHLLKYALIEGSAEFMAELITGHTDGNYGAFKGREKSIWEDFKKDMHKDVYGDWLQAQEPKRPRNGMYWAGYLICKSYYKRAKDKNQAIFDILHIENYLEFYKKSQVDEYINSKYISTRN